MLAAAFAAVAHAQDKASKDKEQDKRPQLKLTARPPLGMAPQKVVLTAEIVGGPDDAEDFYCPTVEWDWGDLTTSESTADCEPYEPGKSSIKRRWTVEHVFQTGFLPRGAAAEETRQGDYASNRDRRNPPRAKGPLEEVRSVPSASQAIKADVRRLTRQAHNQIEMIGVRGFRKIRL